MELQAVEKKRSIQFNFIKYLRNLITSNSYFTFDLSNFLVPNKAFFKKNSFYSLSDDLVFYLDNGNIHLKLIKKLNRKIVSYRKRNICKTFYQGIFNDDVFTLNTDFVKKEGNEIKIKDSNNKDEFNFFIIKDKLHIKYSSNKFKNPDQEENVDSVDCCCLIVHSSLIKQHNLLFDENLKFHCYSEDFSFNAKYNFAINTCIAPITSHHLSLGNLKSNEFIQSMDYLKNKYKGKKIFGTCFQIKFKNHNYETSYLNLLHHL